MSDHKFKNFAVLTLDIHSVEVKESKKGGQYAVAQASLPMDDNPSPAGAERLSMPFRVIVTNGLTKVLKAETTLTLVGHIGYEEKDGKATYLFFPYKFEPSEKPRNFVQLTLRAGQGADCRYTDAGAFWGRIRMALGIGKDKKGEYKPSLWLTVKAFSHNGDETLPQKLAAITKGSLATITGRLTYEVYTNKEGETRVSVGVIASKISDFDNGDKTPQDEAPEKEFEEPNFG